LRKLRQQGHISFLSAFAAFYQDFVMITIINTSVARSSNAGKPTRELLQHISTKMLVIIESGFAIEQAEKVFEPITRDMTEFQDILAIAVVEIKIFWCQGTNIQNT